MSIAISHTSGRGHAEPMKAANFGQLNSAISRGDLSAAQTAFVALAASAAPAAMAAKAKGSLEAVGDAIASGDLDAAKTSLADLRTGRVAKAGASPIPELSLALSTELVPTDKLNQTDIAASTQQILALLTGSGSTVSTLA